MTDDKALAARDEMVGAMARALPLPDGAVLSAYGLSLPDDTPFEDWLALVAALERGVTRAAAEATIGLMAWGDALAHGERSYGEMYTQAVQASQYTYSSLSKAVHVATRVDVKLRREFEGVDGINPSHFAAVAKVTDEKGNPLPALQRRYLRMAADEGLPAAALEREIDDTQAVKDGRDPEEERVAKALARARFALARSLGPGRWLKVLWDHLLGPLSARKDDPLGDLLVCPGCGMRNHV